METKEGSIRATLPWNLPIDQGAFEPLGTLTNPARIGCRHLAEDGSLSGVYHTPPNPARQAWRIPSPPTQNLVQPTT